MKHLWLVVLVLFSSTGFAQQTDMKEEGRALWVTRWNYTTPEDVVNIMKNAEKLNFNVVLFQVRGEGTVFYKSEIEPWSYELTSESPETTGKDPGWDPLALAIEEGHKRGLEVHAWVNVFPAWRSQNYPPKDSGQLWWEHPDWFMHDSAGERMIPRDGDVNPNTRTWYSFISPGVPEVQDYLAELFEEIAANYEIDGLHYDYVRYPAEIREVEEGFEERGKELGNWSYDARSLARFQKETGVAAPDLDPEAWTDWRAAQVTNTVRKINERVRKHRPNLIISAAVIPDPDDARATKYQSYIEWLEKGYLDAVMTMGYTNDLDRFRTRTSNVVEHDPNGYYLAGFGGGYGPEIVKSLIQATRDIEGVDGFCCFAYLHLFEDEGEHAMTETGEALLQGPLSSKAAVPWKKDQASSEMQN